jgi:hypothetical protein
VFTAYQYNFLLFFLLQAALSVAVSRSTSLAKSAYSSYAPSHYEPVSPSFCTVFEKDTWGKFGYCPEIKFLLVVLLLTLNQKFNIPNPGFATLEIKVLLLQLGVFFVFCVVTVGTVVV